jgi:hypothetical protein
MQFRWHRARRAGERRQSPRCQSSVCAWISSIRCETLTRTCTRITRTRTRWFVVRAASELGHAIPNPTPPYSRAVLITRRKLSYLLCTVGSDISRAQVCDTGIAAEYDGDKKLIVAGTLLVKYGAPVMNCSRSSSVTSAAKSQTAKTTHVFSSIYTDGWCSRHDKMFCVMNDDSRFFLLTLGNSRGIRISSLNFTRRIAGLSRAYFCSTFTRS